MNGPKIFITLTVLLGCCGAAHAQYRCDCTSVVDTCIANVVARGGYLEVKTDRPQCARVDYFVDGQPFVSVVVDGEDRQNWLARTTSPKILVQSCQVCRDNGAGVAAAPVTPRAAPATAPAAEGEAAKLEPLIAGVPEYPAGALVRGARGHVDVEFTVNAAGMVEGAKVVASEPKGVFDAAALAAVQRRRYPAEPARAPQVIKERLDFQPPRAAAAAAAAHRAAQSMRAARRRLQLRRDRGRRFDQCLQRAAVGVRLRARHGQEPRPVGLQHVRGARRGAGHGRRSAPRQALHGRRCDRACAPTATPTASPSRARRTPSTGGWPAPRRTTAAARRRANGRAPSMVRGRASIRRIAARSRSRALTDPAPRPPSARPRSARVSMASLPITITAALSPRVSWTTRIVTSKSLCAPAMPPTASSSAARSTEQRRAAASA